METFLKRVASHLYNNTSGDLAHTAVVFPNKRAALFFNEYLAQEAGQPIWSPAYISISELFCQCSELQIGDPIKLVCDLYKVFRRQQTAKKHWTRSMPGANCSSVILMMPTRIWRIQKVFSATCTT